MYGIRYDGRIGRQRNKRWPFKVPMEGGLRMKLRENNIDIFTAVRTSDL
jgi:hypothetical protein